MIGLTGLEPQPQVRFEGYLRSIWGLFEGYLRAIWGLFEVYFPPQNGLLRAGSTGIGSFNGPVFPSFSVIFNRNCLFPVHFNEKWRKKWRKTFLWFSVIFLFFNRKCLFSFWNERKKPADLPALRLPNLETVGGPVFPSFSPSFSPSFLLWF